MRLVSGLLLGLSWAYAQTCVPVRMLPAGTLSGALDQSSCHLSDGTPYAAYRLDLPSRGQIQLDLTTPPPGLALILRDPSGKSLASGVSVHRPIEAGSYSVLVNGSTTGSYSLKSIFAAEPGMMCGSFPNLGLNQTVNGTLGASGCVAPDGTVYEAYALSTLGSGTLTVSVSSTDFNGVVTVRASDGSLAASGAQQASLTVDADDQYQIVVSTADQPGSYQLSTSFQPADGETCQAQKTFTVSDTDTSSITASSCTQAIADNGDLSYFNYYNLTISAAGLADITVSSMDFAATLYLLDDGGNLLALDAGGGPARGQSEIRMPLTPGNYLLEVFSSVPSGGAYSLTYQFAAGSPPPCVSAASTPGSAVSGTLSPASCRTSLGLADLYAITLPASGTLDIMLAAAAFTGIVALRDTKDNLMVLNEDVAGLGTAEITADLPAGTYTVLAAAASGSGAYQLTPAFTPHDIPACTYVQAVDIDGGYIQQLGARSCRDADGQPVDLYQFTLPAGAVVAAFMTSGDVDSFLSLTDTSGNVLRTDDNSYGDNGSLIVQYLPAGTYQLAARAAGSTAGGYYEVDVRNVQGPRPSFCLPKGGITTTAPITASLGISACQYPDGTFADVYQMNVASAVTIDLRLNSSDFDACLVLLDAKGNLVAQDDDSGGGTNARLNLPLTAGTYYVAAKAAAGYTSVGSYTLSLQ